MHIPRMQILTVQKNRLCKWTFICMNSTLVAVMLNPSPSSVLCFYPIDLQWQLKITNTWSTFKLPDDSYIYNRINTCKGVTNWYCDQKSLCSASIIERNWAFLKEDCYLGLLKPKLWRFIYAVLSDQKQNENSFYKINVGDSKLKLQSRKFRHYLFNVRKRVNKYRTRSKSDCFFKWIRSMVHFVPSQTKWTFE